MATPRQHRRQSTPSPRLSRADIIKECDTLQRTMTCHIENNMPLSLEDLKAMRKTLKRITRS